MNMPPLNQDAKEILIAGCSIANALSDGVQLGDLGALMKLPAAIDGWKVGIENLKAELATPEGRAEIEQLLKDEFNIPDDQLEEKIEKTMTWLNATYDLYLTWTATPEGTDTQ